MNIVPVELSDKTVADYLTEAARSIDTQFGSLLSERFNHGRFFAIAPADVDMNRLLAFEQGGLTPPGPVVYQGELRLTQVIQLYEDFAQQIIAALKKWGGSAVVGFDLLSSTTVETNPFDLSNEPFGILTNKDPSTSDVVSFVNNFSTAWRTVAMIVDHPSAVSSATQFSDCIRMFAVSAYDNESFVYWLQS